MNYNKSNLLLMSVSDKNFLAKICHVLASSSPRTLLDLTNISKIEILFSGLRHLFFRAGENYKQTLSNCVIACTLLIEEEYWKVYHLQKWKRFPETRRWKYKHRKNCECCPVSQLIVR